MSNEQDVIKRSGLLFSLIENCYAAFESMKLNKLRTSLSLLGTIIGVAAVILIGAVSKSGKDMIFTELKTFGLNSIWIFKSIPDDQNPGKIYNMDKGITMGDVDIIASRNKLIKNISPVIESRWIWTKYSNRYSKANFFAVSASYKTINSDRINEGRFFSKNDVQQRLPVCVIGIKIKNRLFKRESPLNKKIRIGKYQYTVIGVLKWKERGFLASIGSAGGQDANSRIIVPISVYLRQINSKEIDYIQAESINGNLAQNAAKQSILILKKKYKKKVFFKYQTMQQYVKTTNNILNIVSWVGAISAIVSLVVGGIGIMNIMTTSVMERTKEIGLRKALGAGTGDILTLFLIEAILISSGGGLIGIVIGSVSVFGLKMVTHKNILIAPEYILLASVISFSVGVTSGLYPAIRAAKMDPVEALKFE